MKTGGSVRVRWKDPEQKRIQRERWAKWNLENKDRMIPIVTKNIVKWTKANPEKHLENNLKNAAKMNNWVKEHSDAGYLAKKAEVMSETISKWWANHPEEGEKKAKLLGDWNESHPEQAEANRQKIWEAPAYKFIRHDEHFHRSQEEYHYCQKLQKLYDSGMLHANVRYQGKMEFDWVIGSNRHNPETWQQIIEYHQVKYWQGETEESYKEKRVSKARSLGITCPIIFEIPSR